ncbi:MAG: TIGR02444 family protein [Alphaproteobacteria bacterium]|nr:TIGR02444 family protein [Alphaproteobacteria bacterium]MBV9862090.1 TIGR02444 family protein [Alphaproteobacteria bacterium]
MTARGEAPLVAAEAFWRFSVKFYAHADNRQALLALQDRGGLDVNLVLFALWLGLSGRAPLSQPQLVVAEEAIGKIRQQITEPLRHLRRRLRRDPDADVQRLRRQIAAVELATEKAAQARLAALAGAAEPGTAPESRRAAAERNLVLCLGPRHAASAEAAALRQALAEFAGPG